MRASLATVALWLLGSSTALSQADDWIVLPTTEVEDAPWLARTVDSIDSELRKQGIGVWSSSRAVSAF